MANNISALKPPHPPGRNAPSTLSAEAADRWRKLTLEYAITDVAGLMLVEAALVAWDRMRAAQALIKRDGMVVASSNGQQRAHPAVAIERDSRNAFQRALKQLNLDIEPLRDATGRPPGLPLPLRKKGGRHGDD
jgi:P27 family predicted phage terminase small subunit